MRLLPNLPYHIRYISFHPNLSYIYNFYAGISLSTLRASSIIPRRTFSPSRTYASTAPDARFTEQTVDLPIGGKGGISLSVLYPTDAVESLAANPNVILYLPPGPIFQQDPKDSRDGAHGEQSLDSDTTSTGSDSQEHLPNEDLSLTSQLALATTTSSIVVTVNYRLGRTPASLLGNEVAETQSSPLIPPFYRYPTPVHDTLAGLDWVLQNLRPAQLCVFGTHIGGSLAVMLSLTESRNLRAVAAHEPICDWTSLDEYCMVNPEDIEQALSQDSSSNTDQRLSDQEKEFGREIHQAQAAQIKKKAQRRANSAPSDLVPLLKAREEFFDTPGTYFDSFASPILFLRSTGKDTPKTFPKYLIGPDYPIPVLQKPQLEAELMDLWDIYMQPEEELSNSAEDDPRPRRHRKALSRWPPYGLDYLGIAGPAWANYGIQRLQVTLPWVRLFATGNASRIERASQSPDAGPDQIEPMNAVDSQGEVDATPRKRRASNKSPNLAEQTVLARQTEEMVSVMRRACFWGREKGYGEERVGMTWMPKESASTTGNALLTTSGRHVEEEAGRWFRDIMEGKY